MVESVLPGWIVPFQRAIALKNKTKKKPAPPAICCREKKKPFLCNTAGFLAVLRRAPAVSHKGMFLLSIKSWAVIKTHFFCLNECKLAHLLWWASCPDSSISMIDQLSSCWWRSGNGGCSRDGCGGDEEGRWRRRRTKGMRDERAEGGKNVRKWSETFVLQISFFLSLIRLEEMLQF